MASPESRHVSLLHGVSEHKHVPPTMYILLFSIFHFYCSYPISETVVSFLGLILEVLTKASVHRQMFYTESIRDNIRMAKTVFHAIMLISDGHFVLCRQMTVTSGNPLVECQECHNLYHQDCHKPQVTDKEMNDPRLVWYCARCTRQMKKMVRGFVKQIRINTCREILFGMFMEHIYELKIRRVIGKKYLYYTVLDLEVRLICDNFPHINLL